MENKLIKQKMLIPVDENDENIFGSYYSINGKSICYVKEQQGYFFTDDELAKFVHAAKYSGMSVIDYLQSLNIK